MNRHHFRSLRFFPALLYFLLPGLLAAQFKPAPAPDSGWPTYGDDPGGTRYSPAKQIDRDTVTHLEIAWTFRTGALGHDEELDHKAAFEATPILVDGKLFLSTPYDHVFALDPVAGSKIWEFDPKLELPYGASEVTSRGVSAWQEASAKANQPCALRIFIGTLDARLIALDGATGKPCNDFGSDGEIDLTTGVKLRDPGDYQVTSAPAIYQDLVITGSSIGDNRAVTLERGVVRAYDVRSGHLRWTWDPIAPWANQTNPRTGAGNAWSTLSVDRGTRPGFHSHRKRQPGLLRRHPQRRRKMGRFRGRAQSFHGRIRVGLPGGASRSVGLRCRLSTGPIHLEGRHSGHRHHHQDGPGLRIKSPDRCSSLPST